MQLESAPGYLVGPPVKRAHPGRPLFPEEEGVKAQGKLVNRDSLRHHLHDEFGWRFCGAGGIRLFDNTYYLPHYDEFMGVLKGSEVAGREGIVERYDCDDFAFGLKSEFALYAYKHEGMTHGLAVGVLAGNFNWADTHVACLVVDSDEKMHLVEPSLRNPLNRGGDFTPQAPGACWECTFLIL